MYQGLQEFSRNSRIKKSKYFFFWKIKSETEKITLWKKTFYVTTPSNFLLLLGREFFKLYWCKYHQQNTTCDEWVFVHLYARMYICMRVHEWLLNIDCCDHHTIIDQPTDQPTERPATIYSLAFTWILAPNLYCLAMWTTNWSRAIRVRG